ncbi:MAG: TlpA family protein disulfide reductase [Bacteroidia bacterium]|nr:TlpA family protein disulfide reductase [Bacteroidia bacterium]
MKKLFTILTLAIGISSYAQNTLPSIDIKKLDGSSFNTTQIQNNGKPIILSFWATWCKPCVNELTNILDSYPELQKETGVIIYAVSIDDARNAARVAPFVNGKSWPYEILLDQNGDFKRQLNVNTIPHTFLIDGSGKIVWQHNSYNEGDEEHLFELVRKLAKGETIH